MGGRGLDDAILYRHGRMVEPLAPESPLCMLVGPMTATDFPLANRLRLLSGRLKRGDWRGRTPEAYIAAELKNGGLDRIVLVGSAETPVYLHIKGTSIMINWARAGSKGALATTEALLARHHGARVLAIRAAGGVLVPIATDKRQGEGKRCAQWCRRDLGQQGTEGGCR
jgi:aldehyde:ferredoxin oxidoreductase